MIIRYNDLHKLLLLTLLLAISSVNGNAYQVFDNHVIVALDARNEMQLDPLNWSSCKSMIKQRLPEMLRKENIDSGMVSTIVFSIPELDRNLDNYIHKRKVVEQFTADNISLYWDDLSNVLLDGNRFSLLSIAKPYSLMALKAEGDDVALTQRTYLVLISDLKYNGNDDFYDELRHKPNITGSTLSSILNDVKNVQQNYFYSFLGQETLPRGYIMLFECIPQQKYFALESVADFPHEVIARRTKDEYLVDISISSFHNHNYELLEIEGTNNENRKARLDGFGKLSFVIDKETFKYTDTTHIDLKARVRLLDNIYNRTVLTPEGSELQGAKGLNRRIIVKKEENAKILGIFPLGNLLYKISFWTDNQQTAAVSWGIIFIIVLIVLVLLIVRSNLKFRNNGVFEAFSKK